MHEQPCIRCGECATPCPAGLHPQLVLAALRRGNTASAQALGLEACISCGKCDAYCPSDIPLTARFVQAREAVQQERARHVVAMAARERFHAREARLLRIKEEQAAERERQRSANTSAQAVAAALARAKARRGDTSESQ